MRISFLTAILIAITVGIVLGFAPPIQSQVAVRDTCHDGECQLAGCGDSSATPCTYMDCGGGTEICMKD